MIDRKVLRSAGLTLALIAALSVLALAQRAGNDSPRNDGGAARSGNVAGEFDYYTLVLSWSPTHCSTSEGEGDALQCRRNDGRRHAFVLHGLWPQYEKGYPESCRTRFRPYVPQPVIDGMLDIMPNPKMVIHEYRTHGTCSGLEPAAYYETSRRLYERIEIPRQFENPFETQFMDPENVADEFAALNPGLEASMIAVSCGGPGNRLRDVRVCFSKGGAFRTCGANEDQRRLCRAERMHVPPVRSTKTGLPGPERIKPDKAAKPRAYSDPMESDRTP